MIQLWYTIRFGSRMLAARPVMTMLAVLTMGIGIGVTTSQLMIFQGLMYPELPLPDAEQIVAIQTQQQGKAETGYIHSHLFNYWKEHQNSFDSLFSYSEGTVNVFFGGRPIRYSGSRVDAGFFRSLGVKPILGEGFRPGDDQLEMPKKAVLGYDAWERDFSADPSILGKEILVNGETTVVVGIMPKDFKFPFNSEIWIPDVFYPGQLVAYDTHPAAFVSGRIPENMNVEDAENELNRLTRVFFSEVGEDASQSLGGGDEVSIAPYIDTVTDEDTKNILYLSSTVVILVLLIACANVTNLLLAGFSTRMKEMAIRCALGASRRDMVFQLWVESLMIATGGALLGLIYCLWATDWGNAQLVKMDVPFWYHLSFKPELGLMVVGITVLSAVLAALLPVYRVGRLSINQVLQDDSRTGSSLNIGLTNKTLVVLQISISCALLMVAGNMIKQIHSIRAVDMGFDTQSVLTARMGLFEGKYKNRLSRQTFIKELLRVLNDHEEIQAAAITTRRQMMHADYGILVHLADGNGEYHGDSLIPIFSEGISNRFFETLGVELKQGRVFNEQNIPFTGVKEVIVTEQFAKEHYRGEQVLGRKLYAIQDLGSANLKEEYEIVGVVSNTFMRGGAHENRSIRGMHFHYTAVPHRFLTVVIRPRSDFNPYSLVPLLKRSVAEVDPEIPLYFVETPKDSIENEFAGLRFAANLFVLFSSVALFLSFVGIFGITTFSIVERIQEIGIRKALGATGREVFTMIFKKGGVELFVGLILGTLAGISLTFALNTIFPDTGLVDFVVYFVVVIILTVSSLFATVYPARKAALIQPAEATRVN